MSRVVVIVAAGNGTRMEQRNKTLLPIGGEPAIVHSIRAAAATTSVERIVLVTREDLISELALLISDIDIDQQISIVPGGWRRSDSVANGVREAALLGGEFVAVHDAARPLVTTEMFEAVFAEAERSGAAIVGMPVTDTLKRTGDDEEIVATIDRANLWSAQTPQAFRTAELLEAFEEAWRRSWMLTDEAMLYEKLGKPVMMVLGHSTNLKLTWPGDHELISALFEYRRAKEAGDA